MSKTDITYANLLKDIMANGNDRGDRTGTGTRSVFGRMDRYAVPGGMVPMLTTKSVHFKSVLTELLWFLTGDEHIGYLCRNGVSIWDEWPYKRFKKMLDDNKDNPLMTESFKGIDTQKKFHDKCAEDQKFAETWGWVGRVYGTQMTSWRKLARVNSDIINGTEIKEDTINQVANVIEAIKRSPESRRHLVSMWNPEDMAEALLPCCHYSFQFYSREMNELERQKQWEQYAQLYGWDGNGMDWDARYKQYNFPTRALSVLFNIRSVDVFLGYPFDIASYGIMLNLVANATNHVTDEVVISSGDTHIYCNHFDQVKEQLARDPYPDEPQLKILDRDKPIFELSPFDFELVGYQCHGKIKAPIAV